MKTTVHLDANVQIWYQLFVLSQDTVLFVILLQFQFARAICSGNLILLHLVKSTESQTHLGEWKKPLFTQIECVKPKYTSRLWSRKPRVVFRPTNVIVSLAYIYQLPNEPVFKHLILRTVLPSAGFQGPVSFPAMSRAGSPEQKSDLNSEAGANLHSA